MADTSTRLAAGAERMEKIRDGGRLRQITRFTRNNIPVPPSTLYQRVERQGGGRLHQQDLSWPTAAQAGPVPSLKPVAPTPWRRRLPSLLRWVMGWP